ncbi:uncharacterized protein LTR77_004867 [Saxophila tyrrhenica]|uniref:Uncharacterized protein n=1 Tax=Saxophila tyrrhenica TaxID=1690608 RepID=A0AAV9PEH1_9PEZI|nr:hypothetical protein LTR77_004867 [Saxophila tyrrhenica]
MRQNKNWGGLAQGQDQRGSVGRFGQDRSQRDTSAQIRPVERCDTCHKPGHKWWDDRCTEACIHCGRPGYFRRGTVCRIGEDSGEYHPQAIVQVTEDERRRQIELRTEMRVQGRDIRTQWESFHDFLGIMLALPGPPGSSPTQRPVQGQDNRPILPAYGRRGPQRGSGEAIDGAERREGGGDRQAHQQPAVEREATRNPNACRKRSPPPHLQDKAKKNWQRNKRKELRKWYREQGLEAPAANDQGDKDGDEKMAEATGVQPTESQATEGKPTEGEEVEGEATTPANGEWDELYDTTPPPSARL